MRNLFIFIFVSSIFGYSLFSSLGVVFNFENRQIVIPYRIVVGLISSLLFIFFIKNFSQGMNSKIKIIYLFSIFSFLALFLSRSIVDTYFYLDNIGYEIKLEYWIFTLLVTLLPAFSFSLGVNKLKEYQMVKWGVYFGLLSVIISVYAFLTTVGYDYSTLYSGRINLNVLNSITIGNAGLSLILLSYIYLTKYEVNVISRNIIGLISYLIGFLALVSAGSRGPFLSIITCLIFLFMVGDIRLKNIIYIFLTVMVFIFLPNHFDIYIIERLLDSFFKDEARNNIFNESFILIKQNFFSGSGIFALETYPHNLIVESFLVIGFFGFLLFLMIFIFNLYYAFIMYKRNLNRILPLLYIQYCTSSMVSGTINEALLFWMLTFCFLIFRFNRSSQIVKSKEVF